MKNILVAVDRAGLAESVVPAVIALAAGRDVRVLALHVVDPEGPDSSWWDAAHVLGDVVVRLAQAGIPAEGQARDGSRHEVAEHLAAAAREMPADLIALGSHGRGDVGGLLLGSVGHKLATLTAVSLLVARPAGRSEQLRSLRRLLVAVDASPEAEPAVDVAIELAREHAVEVRLLHAMEHAFVDGAAYLEPESEANAILDRCAARCRRARVTVSTAIADGAGPVAGRITQAAADWDADLVVVGSRRLGELSALVQGSTSHAVLAESDRPVLVAEKPVRG